MLVVDIIFSLIFVTCLCAQVDTAWARRYNGPANGTDDAYAIAVDRFGNTYVTGKSAGIGSASDFLTIKYDALGIEQWVRRYNGIGNADDVARAIAVDDSGNVYVAGQSNTGQYDDYLTIKYNSDGETLWVNRYNGPNNCTDNAYAIAVDDQGYVYVTGTSMGAGGDFDYATVKYSPIGITVWISRYNGEANDYDFASAIALDNHGYIYVTGYSESTATHTDYLTIKYNPSGIPAWIRRYNGPGNYVDEAYAIAVDNQGNVYVTGGNYTTAANRDYVTIKYDSLGNQQWIGVFNGTGNDVDYAKDLAVDNQGNVYVTGWASMTGYARECVTIKYNSYGDTVWTRRYGGSYDQWGNSIAVDSLGYVYVTGEGTYLSTSQDFITIKYSPTGTQLWDIRYNGPANSFDVEAVMSLDRQGNVYVTGCSQGSGTGRDFATIKYVQAGAVEEYEIASPLAYNDIVVFPNPAKTYFTIHLSQSTNYSEIKIFDVSGKLINEIASGIASQPRNDNIVQVSLDGIKNGVYFVKVGNETDLKKLVILK
jgi:uncharacterized delta-60 repeat protein